jgi:hypothetical protein
MKMMRQMIEVKRVMKTNQMMNIQSIVYRIASIIEMTDKILKNEIEMTA